MSKVKLILVFAAVIVAADMVCAQETKKIKGRIIAEDFELLPGIEIHDKDSVLLGRTDRDGTFAIDAPADLNELLLGFIGMEWTHVKIKQNCQQIEMFMMTDVIYDFSTARKIYKKRQKRFKQLPKKHLEAYKQGIFKCSVPCVSYVFTE